MTIVIAVNFRMTIEANWNCVLTRVRSSISGLNDVVHLYLDTAEYVTDTTTSVTGNQQLFHFFYWKLSQIRPHVVRLTL